MSNNVVTAYHQSIKGISAIITAEVLDSGMLCTMKYGQGLHSFLTSVERWVADWPTENVETGWVGLADHIFREDFSRKYDELFGRIARLLDMLESLEDEFWKNGWSKS